MNIKINEKTYKPIYLFFDAKGSNNVDDTSRAEQSRKQNHFRQHGVHFRALLHMRKSQIARQIDDNFMWKEAAVQTGNAYAYAGGGQDVAESAFSRVSVRVQMCVFGSSSRSVYKVQREGISGV